MRYPVLNLGRPALGEAEQVRRAGFLIFRGDGRVLLLRRSPSVRLPGSWDLTGGHVEPGETDWEGALREAREEIGGLPRLRIFHLRRRREGELSYATYMAQTLDDRWEPELNWEHDAWGWFSPGDLPAPLRPSTSALFAELRREGWA